MKNFFVSYLYIIIIQLFRISNKILSVKSYGYDNADADIIAETVKRGLVSIPGAMPPTECAAAWKSGADFIKLFPMSHTGVSYLKTISAPLSHIRFLAVGGVKISEFADYINAGACGFGIGGALGYKEAVLSGAYSIITKCAKEHREAFNKAKMQQYASTEQLKPRIRKL